METFTEEQKIAATARIGQDILSYALEVYTQMDSNTNTNSSASHGVSSVNGVSHDTEDSNNHDSSSSSALSSSSSSSSSSSQLHPLNEALEDAFCILQSPLSKVMI